MNDEKDTGRGRPSRDLDQRLLKVAREILEREGLEALTLRAAARGAGVSHMAPYRHYASKDELLAAVAEHGFQTLGQQMDDAASRAEPAGRLECLGISYILFALNNPALYRLMFGANLPNRARFPTLVDAGNDTLRRCERAVHSETKGDTANTADNQPATREAVAVWALIHGLASLAIDGLVTLSESETSNIKKDIQSALRAGYGGHKH